MGHNVTDAVEVNVTLATFDKGNKMIVFQVMFTLIVVVIMFGMGCAVDHKKLIQNLRRPVGIGVGLSCQIFLMPVLTYALIKLFSLPAAQAIAFMLVGCSPGGSNSNVITYLINGDISLSVAMTSFSNMLALATVPLWVLIFTTVENTSDVMKIPYSSLAITLISIAIPIMLGIGFRYKCPDRARIIPKICSVIAIVALITTIVSMVVVTKMPFTFSANNFLPVALLPFLGMVISYIISCLPKFKLPEDAKRAISVETAIQHGGLANSVLVLTFGDRIKIMGEVMTIPLLFQIFQSSYALILIVVYRVLHHRKIAKPCHKVDAEEETSRSDDAEIAPLHEKDEKIFPTD